MGQLARMLTPQPPSPDELPANVKQAYRAFAAVPSPHPPADSPAQVLALPVGLS